MRPQGHGVQAEGCPAGRGGGGGALFNLLLGVEVVGVVALLFVAVDSTGVQAGVTLVAGYLVTVVFVGKLAEGGLPDATP